MGGASAGDTGTRDAAPPDATARDGSRDTARTSDTAIVQGDGGGSSSTGSDGCTDTLASSLTLQQIAVYQSLKIPIMTDGTEVPVASRKASIVVGRDTTFRVFVTVGNGWTAREVSARLTLTPSGGQATQYYVKKTVSASSTDATLASTFQIQVPASGMTGAMRYSLQIVECGTASGSAGNTRFPASGDTDLGAKATGGLKIKIIPIKVDTLVPDTSQTTLNAYASVVNAMYPITAVSFSVGDTITTPSPVDWTSMLDQLRSKRTSDAPAADVYYFGLVTPASTLRAYCQSSCTSGIGFVVTSVSQASGRAAVGIGYGDKASAFTMAHEVGHNHGRQHSPCVPSGGTISGVDPNYPYSGAGLGSWGWDPRTQTLLDTAATDSAGKPKNTDIMGYCNTQWISDYTYSGITTRVAGVNGATMVLTTPEALSKWRVLLVDDKGPRWGIPIEQETAPEGEPEMATIYDTNGAALDQVVAYRTEISDISASMIWVPEPKPNWYAVEVKGAAPHPFAAPVTTPRP